MSRRMHIVWNGSPSTGYLIKFRVDNGAEYWTRTIDKLVIEYIDAHYRTPWKTFRHLKDLGFHIRVSRRTPNQKKEFHKKFVDAYHLKHFGEAHYTDDIL